MSWALLFNEVFRKKNRRMEIPRYEGTGSGK